ncbi:MAG: hypothetical protein OXC03_05635 [Flavobacteriaceae bacterium]|nr:hypothetical protein [Flavobacteriaceae bacterium]
MNFSVLKLIYLFPLVLLAQVFVFSNFNLFGFIDPQIYLLYFIVLPLKINQIILLLIAFTMGISIDLFLDLPATNAISSITVIFLRPLIILVLLGKSRDKIISEGKGAILAQDLKYIALITGLHQLVYFILDLIILGDYLSFMRNFVFSWLISVFLIWTLLGFKKVSLNE